ncbi:MAG: electron transfer flavoprotein subunit beta/FixA family protein [Deltaproteobacteria bacterium]|nr:electron transfer flavoprotein subunit beta/FixA family protein [Candidatus Anaeroferrophillus wilburensis]MBN2888330.1 electron transfer flavoprotein subunit beta/FixA family protein [Deltaproteobacteria bacterium]
MNIVACIKQTFDTEAKIVINDGQVSDQGVNLIVNPYDEYAVEQSIRLKEKNGGEVVVVSVGGDKTQEALRYCLAMGADRAVLIQDPALANADSAACSVALAKLLADMEYDLIFCGKEAVDDGAAQVPSRLAEKLDLPQANVVIGFELGDGQATVTREIDGGTEILDVQLPALFSAQKGLNEVRYPSLPGIMKAKRKELKVVSLADLGLNADDVAAKTELVSAELPPARKAGQVLTGEVDEVVAKLVALLKNEAKVI